eukprot:Pgem_evm1s12335
MANQPTNVNINEIGSEAWLQDMYGEDLPPTSSQPYELEETITAATSRLNFKDKKFQTYFQGLNLSFF